MKLLLVLDRDASLVLRDVEPPRHRPDVAALSEIQVVDVRGPDVVTLERRRAEPALGRDQDGLLSAKRPPSAREARLLVEVELLEELTHQRLDHPLSACLEFQQV